MAKALQNSATDQDTNADIARRRAAASETFRNEDSPMRWGGKLSPTHLEILQRAGQYLPAPGTREWSAAEALKWKAGGDLFKFKDQWVSGHRDAILAAADRFDLPPSLVGGVAYTEVGGDPPVWDDIGYAFNLLRGKPRNQTSFGDLSLQIRRASQSLGYGASPSADQAHAIMAASEDPTLNIFMAAKHLSDLRDIDFPEASGSAMTKDQLEITASRYNRGPQPSQQDIAKYGSYGRSITKRQGRIASLLQLAPDQ
ncbi:MAG: hypothetical protein JWM33_2401 [Caulobacteraceae bacterium]|nr:hypothetical protein [Caulobacteraceae bacterium]